MVQPEIDKNDPWSLLYPCMTYFTRQISPLTFENIGRKAEGRQDTFPALELSNNHVAYVENI